MTNIEHQSALTLTSLYLKRLETAIDAARMQTKEGAPAEWLRVCAAFSSAELALLICHSAIAPVHHDDIDDDDVPSVVTAVKRLTGAAGFPLTTTSGAPTTGAAALLDLAVQVGLLARPTPDRKTVTRLRLSRKASAELARIERDLAQAGDLLKAQPLLYVPEPHAPEVTPNWRGQLELPDNSAAVLSIVEALQGTAWTINQHMLGLLSGPGMAVGRKRKLSAGQQAAVEQARAFAGKTFYYRTRLDYRGRFYQVGGRLQYTSGDDLARSLLTFARSEPVDDAGLNWLAQHLYACGGGIQPIVLDPWRDRIWINWATSNQTLLANCANRPDLHTEWKKAKEPYQFLAAAKAWDDASKGLPVSLPVRLDATASAMQHFCLLLRDQELAPKVNCWPGSKQDYYSELAKSPVWKRKRSRQDMKAAGWAIYGKKVTPKMVEAIKGVAPRAWDLFERLQSVADEFTMMGQPIRWTTPNGFEVVQDSRELIERKIDLRRYFGAQYVERYPGMTLDPIKQLNSLPANLVHSLDAALLANIIDAGIDLNVIRDWGTAHDAIAVHPNRVVDLIAATKSGLLETYQPDVLGDLFRQWQEQGITQAAPAHDAALDGRFVRSSWTFTA